MNPVFREVAVNTQHGPLMGALTLLFIACFLYWCWWALWPSHKAGLDAAALLPFDEEI